MIEMKTKKGQYFSFDAIVASVIFVMALVALISYWYSVKSMLDSQSEELSKEAIKISSLALGPASPYPRSVPCNFERIGFANSWDDKRLNVTMIECARSALGSSDPGRGQDWLKNNFSTNNLQIAITRTRGGTVLDHPDYLLGPATIPADAKEVVRLRRVAPIAENDGTTSLAYVDFTLYK